MRTITTLSDVNILLRKYLPRKPGAIPNPVIVNVNDGLRKGTRITCYSLCERNGVTVSQINRRSAMPTNN